jgi:hypothetical protein
MLAQRRRRIWANDTDHLILIFPCSCDGLFEPRKRPGERWAAFLKGLVVKIKLIKVLDLDAFLMRLRLVEAWCIVATCVGVWDSTRAYFLTLGNRLGQSFSYRRLVDASEGILFMVSASCITNTPLPEGAKRYLLGRRWRWPLANSLFDLDFLIS